MFIQNCPSFPISWQLDSSASSVHNHLFCISPFDSGVLHLLKPACCIFLFSLNSLVSCFLFPGYFVHWSHLHSGLSSFCELTMHLCWTALFLLYPTHCTLYQLYYLSSGSQVKPSVLIASLFSCFLFSSFILKAREQGKYRICSTMTD